VDLPAALTHAPIMRTHSLVRTAVAAVTVGLVGALAAPASAETVTVETLHGQQVQEPQNNLSYATFTYEKKAKTVITAKISQVETEKTQVGARIFYPGGAVVELFTRYDDGKRFVLGQITKDGVVAPVKARAEWDVEADTVSLIIGRHNDPRPGNRKARLDVFSLTKGGTFTGPHCGPDPRWCHDDWVEATLQR